MKVQEGPVEMGSNCHGCMSVPMFEFLNGKPWGDEAKSFVSALRPSRVRICRNACDCLSVRWRVTVWLNPDDTIRSIEQEVDCELYGPRDERGFTKHCGGDLIKWALHGEAREGE